MASASPTLCSQRPQARLLTPLVPQWWNELLYCMVVSRNWDISFYGTWHNLISSPFVPHLQVAVELKSHMTSLFCSVYDFISLTSHHVVYCYFQASWQRGHVRLWRWTGTAANQGGPSPGRRPAALVRRVRLLELQEPDLPVWTVSGEVRGGGRSQLSSLSSRGHFSENDWHGWFC